MLFSLKHIKKKIVNSLVDLLGFMLTQVKIYLELKFDQKRVHSITFPAGIKLYMYCLFINLKFCSRDFHKANASLIISSFMFLLMEKRTDCYRDFLLWQDCSLEKKTEVFCKNTLCLWQEYFDTVDPRMS